MFYPHGNLSLARDIYDEEYKISSNGSNLLESILSIWRRGKAVPLFISEGTAEKTKINFVQWIPSNCL